MQHSVKKLDELTKVSEKKSTISNDFTQDPFTFHNTKVWINQDSEMDEQSILNLQKSLDSE